MATPSRRKRARKPARSGLGSVDENLARNEERRKRGKPEWVKIGDGNSVVVRAVDLAKEFKDGFVHPVQFERKDGSSYTRDVLCLDQKDEGEPCPGCRDDLERRYKFWMLVIERDAEKLNSSGKVIGEEDKIKIMSGATRLVKALNAKAKRHDLTQRDVEIAQEGESFGVQYEVEWVDDEDAPLSKADKKLLADNEVSIARYTEEPEFDTFYDPPGSDNDDDDDEDIGQRSRKRGSGFSERTSSKKKGSSRRRRDEEDDEDDDDEDDEDEAPRRRSRTSSSKSKISSKKKSSSGLAGMRAAKSTSKTTGKRRRSR